MVQTAGNKLRRARTLRQLSVEDAARATKIRPSQIVDLEGDEYSNFANLAYARGFLVAYAKFLHVDVRMYLEAFEDAGTFGLNDYQYLSEVPVCVYRAPVRQIRRRRRPSKPRFLAAGTTLGVLTLAALGWFVVVSYWRLGGDMGQLAARQEARERAARHEENPVSGEAANGKAPAAQPAGNAIPVSAPVSESPAPSAVPDGDKAVVTTAALAAADNGNAIPVGPLKAPADGAAPAVPLPGDGTATRALTQEPDLRASLAAVPPALNGRDAAGTQAKVRAATPVSGRPPNAPYQGNVVPQPVSNDTVR